MKSKHIPTNINKEKENIAKLHKQIKYYVNVRNELNHKLETLLSQCKSCNNELKLKLEEESKCHKFKNENEKYQQRLNEQKVVEKQLGQYTLEHNTVKRMFDEYVDMKKELMLVEMKSKQRNEMLKSKIKKMEMYIQDKENEIKEMKEYLNEKINDEVVLRQHYEQKVNEMKMERNELMHGVFNDGKYTNIDNEEELNTENFDLESYGEEDECSQRRRERYKDEQENDKNGKQESIKDECANEQSDYNYNNDYENSFNKENNVHNRDGNDNEQSEENEEEEEEYENDEEKYNNTNINNISEL